jgi:hypothetical protein
MRILISVRSTSPFSYKKPMLRTATACALMLSLLPSCFLARTTTNEPLSAERLAALKVGQSTAQDALTTLGAPHDVVQLGRRSAWRYDFSNSKRAGFSIVVVTLLNEDSRSDRAWLFFDENLVLIGAGSTLQADASEFAMPWNEVESR